MRVITFGTFDIFHVGHLHILERAKALGSLLIVGVSSDQLNFDKKGRYPVYPEHERVRIIQAMNVVDEVFVEHSLAQKRAYLTRYQADILVMGDDWKGKFDEFNDICQVVYLTRTPSISTTEVIEIVKNIK